MDPETSEALFIGWWAVLGLMVGSFLNVVIARLPEEGESVARPVRSRCPHCRTTLRWYENLPVLSWLVLRARCRTCRAPISWRYPLVELLTSGLFLWVVSERPGDPALVALQSLVLAGSDWNGADTVHRVARESRYRDQIVLTGFVPSDLLQDLYCGADAVIFPSLPLPEPW